MHLSTVKQRGLPPLLAKGLLLLILAGGFGLRVWGINFDQGLGSHPDERSTVCFYAPSIALPTGWEEFRDPTRSPLNPLWDRTQQSRRSFTYGHFPLYLGVAMGEGWHRLAPFLERVGAPAGVVAELDAGNEACNALPGRLTIALLDTLTIFLVFLVGRRGFGVGAGLLAAALYAVSAQAIQLSHFFAMDPASTTFTVLAVWGGLKMVQERSLRGALWTGVGAGLAIASKFSALPVLALPAVAAILWLSQEAHAEARDGRSQLRAVVGVVLAWGVAGLMFLLTSPYAVLDWDNFAQAVLVEQGQMVRGVADWPFTRQYRNTTPYLYFIQQQLQWGLWWPLGLIGLAGSIYMLGELVRSLLTLARQWIGRGGRVLAPYELANLLMWAWIVPYFGLTGAFLAKFNRYMSPVLPFVMLFAAALIWRFRHGWGREDNQTGFVKARRWAAGGLAAVAVVGGLFWSLAYVNGVYRTEHPWIAASRWIYENAPRGSLILWELWDDALPKSIPGEPGMDMGTTGLFNIDWSPYEEDTAEKYEILKSKLREADFVVYSSKRIYDSVDELPQRYPMTNLYYDAMWDGRLGFEPAAEFTAPPRLFGWVFDDREADESWSLYDHPQVTVFRKVRDLSDAEYDALFDRAWERAIPHYRGQDSPLSPLLERIGLGAGGTGASAVEPQADLMLAVAPGALPLVDNYRWNRAASESPWPAVAIWWFVVTILGWGIWPLVFALAGPLRDGGYLVAKTLGWLVAGWLLWIAASVGLLYNTVVNSWVTAGLLMLLGGVAAWQQRHTLGRFARRNWGLLAVCEGLFVAAFIAFVLVRMANPDLWQPWFGGEKFMEFAFLNGILRSPTFPPLDPHYAGGIINYYYFGIYLVGYLIKLTGIYAEVAFNLAIPMLFAMTVVNSFSLAYAAWGMAAPAVRRRDGFAAALLAPLFLVGIGNLDGIGQVVRGLSDRSTIHVQSALPLLATLTRAASGLVQVARGQASLPPYDFWGPSRVIPNTINEFPYWSFLFADLHPHLIGIPLSLAFLTVILVMLAGYEASWRQWRRQGIGLLLAGTFLLGALASVNLWELPTYFGLGVLALLVAEYRAVGWIRWARMATVALVYLVGALILYWPFFGSYVNVGASGVGFVRAGDELGAWLLIWGFLAFVVGSWVLYSAAARPARALRRPVQFPLTTGQEIDQVTDQDVMVPARLDDTDGGGGDEVAVRQTGMMDIGPSLDRRRTRPSGIERFLRALIGRFDRLPRFWYLHSRLVRRPTFAYMVGVAIVPLSLVAGIAALVAGRSVLGLCLPFLGVAILTMWRRGPDAEASALFTSILAGAGLAILAGTQVVYLKDFLQGGDWYRMNTLFKFFVQVWVLWAMAAAIALPRLWAGSRAVLAARRSATDGGPLSEPGGATWPAVLHWSVVWQALTISLLVLSLAYVLLGTPARLSQRMVGWRPPVGTLDGMAYMRLGGYSWPDESHWVDLGSDYAAIKWLLDNVRGNPVLVESAELDYYRAGGSRVASMTGLSGLLGMHKAEQRSSEQVGMRDGQLREFWSTPDVARMQALIDELDIGLIYVGGLERYLHPDGVARLAEMAGQGKLTTIYQTDGVVIYAVPERMVMENGYFAPSHADSSPDMDTGQAETVKPDRG